jgi:hypothetical protein
MSPMDRTVETTAASRAVLAGVLIACLLIHPAIGAATWIQIDKAAVKRDVSERIRRGIEERDLVALEFPLEKARMLLRWEGSREFEYAGRMYDVVETRVLGDKVVYTCWPDHEETRLNERLRELASPESGEVFDPEGDEERTGPPQLASHGAVVCDWRISDSGRPRFRRPSRIEPPSVALGPRTPPPKPF